MSPVRFLPFAGLGLVAAGALVGYVARGRANTGDLEVATKQVVMFNNAEARVEPRRYPARCECGAPAIGVAESGPYCGWCVDR